MLIKYSGHRITLNTSLLNYIVVIVFFLLMPFFFIVFFSIVYSYLVLNDMKKFQVKIKNKINSKINLVQTQFYVTKSGLSLFIDAEDNIFGIVFESFLIFFLHF